MKAIKRVSLFIGPEKFLSNKTDAAEEKGRAGFLIPQEVFMDIEIRKATSADSDPIFNLVERFATSFTPERKAFDTSLKNLLCDDSVLLMVSEFNQAIVAYCLAFDHYTLYANGRVTWVEEIMVREDLRGKGIGKDLMESVEQWAIERKSRLIGLATRRAAPFYSAIGYEESAIFFRKMMGYES
jgi:GNAT superfamily N-acetyltransferase